MHILFFFPPLKQWCGGNLWFGKRQSCYCKHSLSPWTFHQKMARCGAINYNTACLSFDDVFFFPSSFYFVFWITIWHFHVNESPLFSLHPQRSVSTSAAREIICFQRSSSKQQLTLHYHIPPSWYALQWTPRILTARILLFRFASTVFLNSDFAPVSLKPFLKKTLKTRRFSPRRGPAGGKHTHAVSSALNAG